MLLAGWRVTLGQGTHLLFPAWPCESLPGDLGDGDSGCFCHHQLLGDACVQAGLSCPRTTPSHSWESDAHGLNDPMPTPGAPHRHWECTQSWQPLAVAPLSDSLARGGLGWPELRCLGSDMLQHEPLGLETLEFNPWSSEPKLWGCFPGGPSLSQPLQISCVF